jgi:hypothetical protein
VSGNGKGSMTTKSGQLIGPKDVVAVQFECGKCGVRINVSLSDAAGSWDHDALRQFIDGLSQVASALRSRAVKVAIEIRGPHGPEI